MWIFPGTASGGAGTVSDIGAGGGVLANWAQATNRKSPTHHAGRSDCIIERRDSRAPRRGQTGFRLVPSHGLTLLPTATTVRKPAMSCCRSFVTLVLALVLSTGSAGFPSLALRCGHCGPHC